MKFSILYYNTLFNSGYEKIGQIIKQVHPDILCFQETKISDDNLSFLKQFNYKLADTSNSFIKLGSIFGAATFYNPDKFKFIKSTSSKISINIAELVYSIPQLILGINKPKTVLQTDFIDKKTNKRISVCNAHLIVVAPNSLRVTHLQKALNFLKIKKNVPLIIGGDFNYLPYQRRKLEKAMQKFHLTEASNNISKTVDFTKKGKKEDFSKIQGFLIRNINRFFGGQMKNDYIFYRGLKLIGTERLEYRFSDHYPMISFFEL